MSNVIHITTHNNLYNMKRENLLRGILLRNKKARAKAFSIAYNVINLHHYLL